MNARNYRGDISESEGDVPPTLEYCRHGAGTYRNTLGMIEPQIDERGWLMNLNETDSRGY